MNILIVNGSPRKDGSTSSLLGYLAKTAAGAGCSCEHIHLIDMDYDDCRACKACKETGECAVDDDMKYLYARIKEADILLLGSPIYMGAETGRMKCFLDRLYAFLVGRADDGATFDSTLPPGKRMLAVFTCGNDRGCILYDGTASRYTGFFRDRLRFRDALAFVVPIEDSAEVSRSCYAINIASALEGLISGEDLPIQNPAAERPIEGHGVEEWGRDTMYSKEDEEDLLFSEEERPRVQKKGPCLRDGEEKYPQEDEDDRLFREDESLRCPRSQLMQEPSDEDEDNKPS